MRLNVSPPSVASQRTVPPLPARGPALRDPVKLSARRTHTLTVKDAGGPTGLHAFMSLPPSAYSALDRDHISRVPSRDGATFRLRVPRAQLLSVYLEPSVTVTVAGVPRTDGRDGLAAVKLSSSGCVLDGSPLVAALRIDERFALSFDATLTWNAAVDGGAAARPATSTADAETWTVDRRAAARPATLTADVQVSVWAEPVGPFLLVPRPALAAAGDALLSRLSAVLLPRFLGLLAADYAKWSQDAAYRAARSGSDAVVSVR